MISCIICHLGINKVLDSSYNCPNEHPTHADCLKQWLLHSSSCPLCSEPYSSEVLDKFKDFINHIEEEKLAALNKELKIEELKKMEEAASKITFRKFIESINILIKDQKYDNAISRLELHEDTNLSNEKDQEILFLKGKINYMRGRYDLTVNQLLKLVRKKYNYPEGFFYLGKAYEAIGLKDQAKWAYDRVN